VKRFTDATHPGYQPGQLDTLNEAFEILALDPDDPESAPFGLWLAERLVTLYRGQSAGALAREALLPPTVPYPSDYTVVDPRD